MIENLDEAKEIIQEGGDPDFVEMAQMQLAETKEALPEVEQELKLYYCLRILMMITTSS